MDRSLALYVLPDNLRIDIQSKLPKPQSITNGDTPEPCPMTRFFPSGEVEPLQVSIVDRLSKDRIALQVTATGKVQRIGM
jgi:hypothetical protein